MEHELDGLDGLAGITEGLVVAFQPGELLWGHGLMDALGVTVVEDPSARGGRLPGMEAAAHLAVASVNCTKPGCVNEGTEKGPGGHLYCVSCSREIRGRQSVGHAGTAGLRPLNPEHRTELPGLAAMLRRQLMNLERAAAARSDAERKLYRARRDALQTVAQIIEGVRELADTPAQR